MRKRSLRSRLSWLAAVVAFGLSGCGGEPVRTGPLPALRIVTDAVFPPFHLLDASGAPTGFDVELARASAQRAGFEPVVEVVTYDELFDGLEAGRHDLIAATTGVTPEREERYLFTEPYFETFQAALVRTGPGEPKNLAELEGRKVGASGSGTASRALHSLAGVEPVRLDEEGVAPLEDGSVDAIVVDEFDAVAMARASGGSLRVLPTPVAFERYAFVLAPGQAELKGKLDAALASLEAEGEIARLRERFGVERDAAWPVVIQTGASHAVTEGVAPTVGPCAATIECGGGSNIREALCGEITADDGSRWSLPAPITSGPTAVDVFNECTEGGANEDYESELETQTVDGGGEVITAHLFADNYFELYVNGAFVGRDAVAFTPFNAHAARFRVDYPVTYAVMLVDWEGYLGVGLEDSRGRLHIGDGGFIATFSDGTATDATWKCRPFYIAPVDDASCVSFDEHGNADSSSCPSSDDTVSCIESEPMSSCKAVHVALPDDWMEPGLDDSSWPAATTYTADEVTGAPGFRNYEDTLFREGTFIWSGNLDLDNLVVCRKAVEARP